VLVHRAQIASEIAKEVHIALAILHIEVQTRESPHLHLGRICVRIYSFRYSKAKMSMCSLVLPEAMVL
jgi:hypothetical protein